MILNQKVPVVKIIPLISRVPRVGGGGRGRGTGCHGDPPLSPLPSPMDLKSDCIKEIACPILIFRK